MAQNKECIDCVHHERHVCVDDNNQPIVKGTNGDDFWYYEVCKKNWGLPQNAYTNANQCKFYRK